MKDDQKETKLKGQIELQGLAERERERESNYRENCSCNLESFWREVKLGEVCKIYSGEGLRKTEYILDGNFPVIGANGKIGRYHSFNNDHPVLTTGRVGTIGTVHRVNKAWIGDNALIIDIKNPSEIDYDLLYYLIQTIDFKSITTGNAQPLLTQGRLKEMVITFPEDIQEQQRIAKLLSNLDKLSKLHSYKAGILSRVKTQLMNQKSGIIETERQKSDIPLGWIRVKLGDVFKLKRGYVLSKSEVKEKPEGDYIYPVYSSQTINDGIMGYYNQYLFEDCITWTTDGAYAGTFRYRPDKFYCTNVCGVLTDNQQYSNTCIATIINLIAQRYVSRGGNPKLMNNMVAGMEVCIPSSLEEQQHIARLLESYDGIIDSELQLMQLAEREREQLQRELLLLS